MFVYSMRAGTVRFFSIVCVALLVLVALVAFVPELQPVAAAGEEETESIRYEGVESVEDEIAFLAQFGWEVEPAPLESATVTIPAEFDKIFSAYNELQKEQGLDLSKYKRKEVTRYTFSVTNYEGFEGTVYANVLVYRNRVIGGDICSADVTGFVHGFER